MRNKLVIRIILALVLIAALVGVGLLAFQLGFSQGLVREGGQSAFERMPMFYHTRMPFSFGFFGFPFLGCLGGLLLLALVGLAARGIFGPRPPRPWMHDWGKGVPPHFEEWHRRLHEEPKPSEEQKPPES